MVLSIPTYVTANILIGDFSEMGAVTEGFIKEYTKMQTLQNRWGKYFPYGRGL